MSAGRTAGGVSHAKPILYVDMDKVLVDFRSAERHVEGALWQTYDGRRDEIPGVFALMDPMPHAIESFRELAIRFDTYVLSTAPWENPSAWPDKLEWVQHHLGPMAYRRLILTHHKNLNHGDHLVDDRTKHGADRFVDEHIRFGAPPFGD